MANTTKFIILLVFATGCLMFHQDDYRVKLDRVDIGWFDDTVFENANAYFFRYNRTLESKVLNATMTIKKESSKRVMFHVQVYKFASMEYRLFPMNYSMDVCKVIEKDTFGTSNIWASTNIRCCCPFKKGKLVISNYMLDQSKLPPHVPRGRYKADVVITAHQDEKVMNISFYYEIESIIRWQK